MLALALRGGVHRAGLAFESVLAQCGAAVLPVLRGDAAHGHRCLSIQLHLSLGCDRRFTQKLMKWEFSMVYGGL